MAEIIPFKSKQQLETEKAKKAIRDWDDYLHWEEANWYNVINKDEDKIDLSQDEVDWLNEWLQKSDK